MAAPNSGGGVINIIGSHSRVGKAQFTIGGATNAALVNLTKSLADLGAAEGVRVNAVNPGIIATDRLTRRIDMAVAQSGAGRDDALREILQEYKVTRPGQPAEVAALVAFLAGRTADYVQGAIVDIDGGLNRAV